MSVLNSNIPFKSLQFMLAFYKVVKTLQTTPSTQTSQLLCEGLPQTVRSLWERTLCYELFSKVSEEQGERAVQGTEKITFPHEQEPRLIPLEEEALEKPLLDQQGHAAGVQTWRFGQSAHSRETKLKKCQGGAEK